MSTQRIKIKIEENIMRVSRRFDYECSEIDYTNHYSIDYDKWKKLKEENSFAAGYVEHFIEGAIAGRVDMAGSRKYSFNDTPEWFDPIMTEEPDSAFDKVITLWIEIG